MKIGDRVQVVSSLYKSNGVIAGTCKKGYIILLEDNHEVIEVDPQSLVKIS